MKTTGMSYATHYPEPAPHLTVIPAPEPAFIQGRWGRSP